ncbi:hypothetical protein F5I97DRAFT_1864501 [Phlebopus sp. FC_14]|nr:hypothetical protein F5I97DRAFT_1864501 [Phlebopus sp. FC_14]
MMHYRDPTCSYGPNTTPRDTETINATLALRRLHTATPTLLSALRTNTNTPQLNGGDSFDDFQSNAWIESHSYPHTLAGLGISYGTHGVEVSSGMRMDSDTQHPAHEVIVTPMKIDAEEDMISLANALAPDALHYLPSFSSAPNLGHPSLPSVMNRASNFLFEPIHSHGNGPSFDRNLAFDHDFVSLEPIGLIPDVNMYKASLSMHPVLANVNPMDTIGKISPACGEGISVLQPPSQEVHTIIPDEDGSKTEECPSPGVIKDIMSILTRSAHQEFRLPPSPSKALSARKRKRGYSSADEFHPSLSPLSKMEERLLPRDQLHALLAEPFKPEAQQLSVPDVAHLSPVLNAHLGIELNELSLRADRFRAQNPGQEIDRTWLSHFAGKLSDRGELLGEFRCYVIGCNQRNKRRDHILVHVGAHIGQRPFACSVCSLRFLRKNECKRHEASHTGSRPYSCDLCGQAFVRQDLVKRHVKRTHMDENCGSSKRRARKKAKK